jgi:hypothetical protein
VSDSPPHSGKTVRDHLSEYTECFSFFLPYGFLINPVPKPQGGGRAFPMLSASPRFSQRNESQNSIFIFNLERVLDAEAIQTNLVKEDRTFPSLHRVRLSLGSEATFWSCRGDFQTPGALCRHGRQVALFQ